MTVANIGSMCSGKMKAMSLIKPLATRRKTHAFIIFVKIEMRLLK